MFDIFNYIECAESVMQELEYVLKEESPRSKKTRNKKFPSTTTSTGTKSFGVKDHNEKGNPLQVPNPTFTPEIPEIPGTITEADLHIDPYYESLVPRPSSEEGDALKFSLEKNGQRVRIVVNQKGAVVDGHTRFPILKELGIPIQFEVIQFATKEDEIAYILDSAALRRNMRDFAKIKMVQPMLEMERAKALERQKLGVKQITTTNTSSSFDAEVGNAIDIVAKRYGISPGTFWRGQQILDHGAPELITQVLEGELTINGAFNLLKGKTKNIKLPVMQDLVNKSNEASAPQEKTDQKISVIKTEVESSNRESEIGDAITEKSALCGGCGGFFPPKELKQVELCASCIDRISKS
jgi:hypothetical protein